MMSKDEIIIQLQNQNERALKIIDRLEREIKNLKNKNKKKVFSVKKFEEICKQSGIPHEYVTIAKISWANKCEGLTKQEIEKEGFSCSDSWLV